MAESLPAPRLDRFANHLLVGECLDVLSRLPDSSVDLTVCSPPYDDLRTWETPAPLNLPALGDALFRVTKDGGVCALILGDASHEYAKSLTSFRTTVDWCNNRGWRLFECCVYQRPGKPGPWWKTRLRVDHEYIFLFFKGKKPKSFHKERLLIPTRHGGKPVTQRHYVRGGKRYPVPVGTVTSLMQCRGTVWPCGSSSREHNPLKSKHPAPMPDTLARDLILGFSEPGDVVLDPMVGSGTVCVCAAQTGRQYVGIDASAAYIEIARQRLLLEAPSSVAQT